MGCARDWNTLDLSCEEEKDLSVCEREEREGEIIVYYNGEKRAKER